MTGWFWTCGHIVGKEDWWTTEYHWDGAIHATREQAIRDGLRVYQSDDFNVGRIEDGALVWFGWMDEPHPTEDYAEVAAALGLVASGSVGGTTQ